MLNEPYPLPFLGREDYETFRGLNGSDLPDTYDEWFKLHSKQKLDRSRVGYVVKEIQVDPNEFVRFCATRRIVPNGDSLLKFAFGKNAGENY